jgi:hypothetical protein
VFDAATGAQLGARLAYPAAFTGGVFVATRAPQNRMTVQVSGMSVAGGSASQNGSGPSATSRRPAMIAGWAYVEGLANTGISAIHVYAQPVSGGAPIFVGAAALGDPSPDVATRYGAQYERAGFHLSANALPPGTYDLVVFAQNARTGTFQLVRTVRATKTP